MRGVRESSQMAWNGLGMKWEPAARPGDVGWVYILTLQKLAIGGKKLAVMTYRPQNLRAQARSLRGPGPPRKRVEPLWVFKTT